MQRKRFRNFTIIKVFYTGLHTIAMLKDTPKIYYTFNGEKKSLRQIYHSVKKRRGKSKYLASVLVELTNKEGKSIPAKIVFVRARRNKSKWLALVSTDISVA